MSTTTQHLGLIQPALSEKHGATTYKANNTIIDNAYGEYLNNYEQSLENVAPIEGDTASTNYSVGQYIIKDGGLYRVTSSIASGESIVVGTNVIATSLNEAVASLNNTVASINNAIGTVNVATNGNLQSQVSALRDSVGQIGATWTSNTVTNTVPNETTTVIRRGTIPAGTWLITSYVQWDANQNTFYNHSLNVVGSSFETVRSNMTNGGGSVNVTIVTLSVPTLVDLSVWQSTGGTISTSVTSAVRAICLRHID